MFGTYRRCRPSAAVFVLVGAGVAGTSSAADVELGEWKGQVNTTVTIGTQMRTQGRDQDLAFRTNGATQGIAGNPLTGQNDDDSNLNFDRGDTFSTVLKAFGEMRLKRDNTEVVLGAKAWYDLALEDGGRPWGNIPNGYQSGQPLSDDGFGRLARFSGIQLMSAYVAQRFALQDQTVDVRLGNQSLQQWGERSSLGGGLSAVSPVDYNAARRAGAIAAENAVPVPQLFGRWQFAKDQSVEAFYQFAFRHSELPGCGTYFAGSDYVADGCGAVFPGAALSDGAKLAAVNYVKRAQTPETSDSGQFGVAYRFRADALNSNLGLYFSRYHNRTVNLAVVKSTRATPFIPGDPNGENVQYLTEYAEKVRVWGLSLETRVDGTALFGELTYRPNQPLGLNGTDLLNAFLSNTAPSLLRQDAIDTAAGDTYHGYDRHRMVQLQFGAMRPIKGLLGSDTLTLAGEVGIRQYPGLPDVTVRRYGRSTLFGLGPVSGTCLSGSTSVMCSNNGYVTGSSWGYRLRASARYPGLLAGNGDLVATIGFAHDVDGWSHDGVFNEGRKLLNLTLRGEYQKRYFAELSYLTVLGHGGDYDNFRDRDYLTLSAGINF